MVGIHRVRAPHQWVSDGSDDAVAATEPPSRPPSQAEQKRRPIARMDAHGCAALQYKYT